MIISQAVLPSKAADSSIMDEYSHKAIGFSKMRGLKSSTLNWCSFLEFSCHVVESIFAFKGGRLSDYESMSLPSPTIFQDTRRKVIEVPLTLIFST